MQCFIIIIIIKVDYQVLLCTFNRYYYQRKRYTGYERYTGYWYIPGIPAGQVILYIASIQYDDDYDLLGVFLL